MEIKDTEGNWRVATRVENNYQRLVKIDVDCTAQALRFVPEETWGLDQFRVFAWDIS